MRILLAANASYVPPRGGATRSNIVWLDLAAAAGHQCRIVAAELAHDREGRLDQIRDEEIEVVPAETEKRDGVEVVRRGSVAVFSAADPGRRARFGSPG